MAYLDVSPLMVALRSRPTDFEFNDGWLLHVPSSHRFRFDWEGNVTVMARCDCSRLSVVRDQGLELWATFKDWRQSYWWPIEVNREFSSHFREPNAFQRLFRALRTKWRLRKYRAAPDLAPNGGIVAAE